MCTCHSDQLCPFTCPLSHPETSPVKDKLLLSAVFIPASALHGYQVCNTMVSFCFFMICQGQDWGEAIEVLRAQNVRRHCSQGPAGALPSPRPRFALFKVVSAALRPSVFLIWGWVGVIICFCTKCFFAIFPFIATSLCMPKH